MPSVQKPIQQEPKTIGRMGGMKASEVVEDRPAVPAKSKTELLKAWGGSRSNFQASYGLEMTPEDIEEGDAIIAAILAKNPESGC